MIMCGSPHRLPGSAVCHPAWPSGGQRSAAGGGGKAGRAGSRGAERRREGDAGALVSTDYAKRGHVWRPPSPPPQPATPGRAAMASDLLPLGDWYRHHSLRSWPVQLFLALICVPAIALVIVGGAATTTTFDAGAWIFAAYFAIAWLLLLGVIIRPEHVTRPMLIIVTAIALLTQVPLAVTLEADLHATNANLFQGIVTIGLPEELAKVIPVLAIAVLYWRRRSLEPRDYLFVGAVSGLVFGASEVVRYFTVNGVAEFYATVQSAIPTISQLLNSGQSDSPSVFSALICPVLVFVLDFVWLFVTDPI